MMQISDADLTASECFLYGVNEPRGSWGRLQMVRDAINMGDCQTQGSAAGDPEPAHRTIDVTKRVRFSSTTARQASALMPSRWKRRVSPKAKLSSPIMATAQARSLSSPIRQTCPPMPMLSARSARRTKTASACWKTQATTPRLKQMTLRWNIKGPTATRRLWLFCYDDT